MTKKSKYLISIIVILGLLVVIAVIVASFLSSVPSEPTEENNEVARILDDVDELIDDTITQDRFEIVNTKAGVQVIDPVAGYEFTLPTLFGEINKNDSEKNKAILVANVPDDKGSLKSQVLAYAYNIDDEVPGRGAFWGDTAAHLNGNIISNFCQTKSEIPFVQPGFDSCSVSTNSYNVTYVRLDYSAYDDWGRIEPAVFFYIFNPAKRNGIVISNMRLSSDQKSDLTAMQSLIDSLSFIE